MKVLETKYQEFQKNQPIFLKSEFKNDNIDQRWTRLGDFICSVKREHEMRKCIDFDIKGIDLFNGNFKSQAFISNRTFKTNQKWILRPPSYIPPSKNITFFHFITLVVAFNTFDFL